MHGATGETSLGPGNRGEMAKMHASIRKYKIDRDAVAAHGARVENGSHPMISKFPGFASCMVIEAGKGVVAAVGILECEKAAERSNTTAAAWARESPSGAIREAPEVAAGEIALAPPTSLAW